MAVTRYDNLRVAADLAAGAEWVSPAVPIQGAAAIAFITKATSTSQPTAATSYDYSLDGAVTWISGPLGSQNEFFTPQSNIALSDNTTARCAFLTPRIVASVIAATHIRLRLTAGGTTMTAFSAKAVVWFQIDMHSPSSSPGLVAS